MNICTICTEGVWEKHLQRWLRYAQQFDYKTHLILATDDERLFHPQYPTIKDFDSVKTYPMRNANRPWFNRVRMSATTIFGVDEMLYLDCDSDILEDVSDIPTLSEKSLMYVPSPVPHRGWFNACQQLGYGKPDHMANNGLLYMREDFTKQYDEAVAKVAELDTNPRVVGTLNFNVMLHDVGGFALPESYQTVWWQCDKWLDAKILAYCNDDGQKKRLKLEKVWECK